MAISAATSVCAIVLHPAGHTRSPAMHNTAFAAMGIDAVYVAFDVPPAALDGAIAGARALGIRQLAVSLPHKEAVLPLLDDVDETARAIGAVNTVTRVDGRLVGSNTDWLGAVRALERATSLAGAEAVVLGAGGTARAATFGLLERGARVTVLNRTPAKAEALARDLGAHDAGPLASLAGREFGVLVNTTSVGLGSDASPVPAGAHRRGSVVMDAVYQPARTRLLADAEAAGAIAVGGKWMLVLQAAEQIRLWTGRDAPLDAMAEAFDRAGTG
ncbi:MAG: shikimate dehydrogenase [Myxococcota bacterium]|nr:shikimate dehydrogenase [Myxococcales bacterium]